MNSEHVFSNLNQENFSQENWEILEFLKPFLPRVIFTKSYLGLPNSLFIAEANSSQTNHNLIACFGIYSNPLNKTHSFSSSYENQITDCLEIKKNLFEFFYNSNDSLYVEISFNDSVYSNDLLLEAMKILSEDNTADKHTVLSSLRSYPSWYLTEENDYSMIKTHFKNSLSEIIPLNQIKSEAEILKNVQKALIDNNQETFFSLASKFSDLKNHLS